MKLKVSVRRQISEKIDLKVRNCTGYVERRNKERLSESDVMGMDKYDIVRVSLTELEKAVQYEMKCMGKKQRKNSVKYSNSLRPYKA